MIPELERSPVGGHGNPLQYSCLENLHEQRSLEGYGPRGLRESDTTERLSAQHIHATTNVNVLVLFSKCHVEKSVSNMQFNAICL